MSDATTSGGAHPDDERLSAALDGLDDQAAAHATDCAPCGGRLEELRRAAALAATPVDPPASEHRDAAIAAARDVAAQSPQAIRMLKFAFNLPDDGMVGQQVFAGEATRLAYMTDEAVEGKEAFLEKRYPDWSPFPWYF